MSKKDIITVQGTEITIVFGEKRRLHLPYRYGKRARGRRSYP